MEFKLKKEQIDHVQMRQAANEKYGERESIRIERMKPKEFLQRIVDAKEWSWSVLDDKYIPKLAEKIKKGEEQDAPSLNYKDGKFWSHDGRHRGVAAICAGVEEIPVLIIERWSDKSKDVV